MSDANEETQPSRPYKLICINCEIVVPPTATHCPNCNIPIAPGTVDVEVEVGSMDVGNHVLSETSSLFSPEAHLILDFLHLADQYVSLPMEQPIILGRASDAGSERFLDLTEFQGQSMGVSRQHCELKRKGHQVLVTDLRSTNGTHLNGKQLVPFEEYKLAHKNYLVIGALQVQILFSDMD